MSNNPTPNNSHQHKNHQHKVALITGAARRIGKTTAEHLHTLGWNVIIHYHHSADEAHKVASELNQQREHSATSIQGDLCSTQEINNIVEKAIKPWGRMDALINNASTFYPTPLETPTTQNDNQQTQRQREQSLESAWEDLFATNLKAPFFLCQKLAPFLRQHQGCIVNIADIHGIRPMKNYPIYSMAKAGNIMMTQSLAKEFAPEIRVNGVAPGAILWPEDTAELSSEKKSEILSRIPLGTPGAAKDIANTIAFLLDEAHYITGQILPVDGGRTLTT
ncbi:pteridine reductase [Marinibactrum halimedae]|uniref:Pteridine reductase n=1 Tax=Marinibactrum halimedae TaxID=1444977 RepID=A0AA37T2T4_9GAMM|nr:pteridine reductase [Marinibactrum halimedae]MCD9459548.1 pteridine reductase [Marinibactrum halimedae]GLS25635.1 pteridine reductase [Marinibactrum halimedae]